ncbi:MAG: hypothetical protein ABSG75_01695 [Syntrophales bacterium]|jgi:hypothetical protein
MEVHNMDAIIVINSGLADFIMLDKVLEVNASRIIGAKSFIGVPAYLRLESLAQLGAFHVRYITGFSRHVFLIKIVSCSLPLRTAMEGEYVLSGNLVGSSDSSFRCFLRAENDKETAAEAELMYAAVDYDHNFKKGMLHDHYTKVFSCLQRDLRTG